MHWGRAALWLAGAVSAALALAMIVARIVSGLKLSLDPALTAALGAAFASLAALSMTSARTRLASAEEHQSALKRVAEVQKRTIERLQLVNAELKENEQRYRGLVDAQGDVILRKWPDGRLTFVNDAFLEVFGCRREAVIGTPFETESHPDDPPPFPAGPGDASGRATHRYDQRIRTRAGWRWYAWEDYAIHGEGGQVVEIQSVGRDITERKEVESAIKAARDRAEQTNKAKSLFLATMSHEIRTPMNGVIGMAGLLLDSPLSPDQRAYALAVKQSGEALVELINDILDFSKIEAGGLELTRAGFGLRALVDAVAELLSTRAYQKGIDIAACIDRDVPDALIGDEVRLRQILINLAGNAVKFTERGGVTLRVVAAGAGTTPAQKNGPLRLRFEIADTGIGVPADSKDRIFGTFEQADSTHSRKYGGSGLGLAISKKIVEQMGGAIGVESAPGEGSVFWFEVPLTRDRLAETGAAAPDLARRRIAILSASSPLRETLTHRLVQGGAEIHGFSSLADALPVLRDHAFHAVLADFALPDGDAETLLPALKAATGRQTSVVVLLPPGQRARIPAFWAAGADAYHITPVRHGWLERRLVPMMNGQPVAAAPMAGQRPPAVPQAPRPVPAMPLDAPNLAVAAEDALSILVAEDNEINTLLTVSLIKRMGHTVDSTRDGAEAIAALGSGARYDLILMDVHMPVVDGIEATRRIRQAEKTRTFGGRTRIPIIALTASAMDEDRRNCIEAGMDDFLTKPLDPNALTAVLAKWARGRPGKAA